jgi:hypothetical protein
LTEKNLFKREQKKPETVAKADFVCATITEITTSGLRILVDGETEPTSKVYKQLITDHYLAVGDRVIAMLQNGTYVVLGTIGVQDQGSGVYHTQNAAEVATGAEGWNATAVDYWQWGKLAMLQITMRTTQEVTITTDSTIGTLIAGKRPATTSSAQVWLSTAYTAIISSTGALRIGRNTSTTVAADYGVTIMATYLLP